MLNVECRVLAERADTQGASTPDHSLPRTRHFITRSVADRTHSWRKEKNQQADARRNATVSKELDGCTFQPQINKSSRRAMTISRYGSFTSPAFLEAPAPARADLVTAVL